MDLVGIKLDRGNKNSKKPAKLDSSLILFRAVSLLSIFLIGMYIGQNKLFPYPVLKGAIDSARLVFQEAGMITGVKPKKHLFPARYPGSDLTKNLPGKSMPGFTLITSFFDGGLEIRLLDPSGEVINRWPVSYWGIWSGHEDFIDPSDRPKRDWNSLFNGVVAAPDGSITFPLGGLVQLDRCGNIIMRAKHQVHHSLEQNSNGNYWVPGTRRIREKSHHAPIRVPYIEHTVLLISADGDLLEEISMLDVLWENDMLPELFANNRQFDSNPENDVVHLNDVEEIPAHYLDQFPQFGKGDLLISLREGNMVLVLEPATRKVKWYMTGPWIQQHDADWQPDGTISVFNNNYDRSKDGSIFGGSNIISVYPQTKEFRYLYGQDPDQSFYTDTQGDHQILDNGNILITESNAGRVFEVDIAGEVVWEFINAYSENEAIRIPDAVRYPPDYFSVESWACN